MVSGENLKGGATMDKVRLKDFRCFHEEQTARLAPLTLLVGENSTGKTSFMAMIRALWNFAFEYHTPDFKDDPYDLGSFDEIAHFRGGRGGRATSFSAGFYFTPQNGRNTKRIGSPYWFDIEFEKKGAIPVPTKRCLLDTDKKFSLEYHIENESGKLYLKTENGRWVFDEDFPALFDDIDLVVPFGFILSNALRVSRTRDKIEKNRPTLIGINGSGQPNEDEWKSAERIFDSYRYSSFPAEYMYASAPVRSKPKRTYDPSRPTRDSEGDYVPMYLASMNFQKEDEWKQLKKDLESFGQEAGLFAEISLKRFGKTMSEPFQLQVGKFGKRARGPKHNLIDVGYGISQALPIITELFRKDGPSTLLLQQPEVHLHPSAQAALGSQFCRIAGRGRQVIVETHSDHLIDRVRMDIRDSSTELKPEDVSILYFERNDLDVKIHSLEIDKDGNILNAPRGYRQFFMDEVNRSYGLT